MSFLIPNSLLVSTSKNVVVAVYFLLVSLLRFGLQSVSSWSPAIAELILRRTSKSISNLKNENTAVEARWEIDAYRCNRPECRLWLKPRSLWSTLFFHFPPPRGHRSLWVDFRFFLSFVVFGVLNVNGVGTSCLRSRFLYFGVYYIFAYMWQVALQVLCPSEYKWTFIPAQCYEPRKLAVNTPSYTLVCRLRSLLSCVPWTEVNWTELGNCLSAINDCATLWVCLGCGWLLLGDYCPTIGALVFEPAEQKRDFASRRSVGENFGIVSSLDGKWRSCTAEVLNYKGSSSQLNLFCLGSVSFTLDVDGWLPSWNGIRTEAE